MIPPSEQVSTARSRPAPLADDGISIIEVMVAALILVMSAVAVLGVVNAASRSTFRAEQSQVVNDRLQQEMEKIKRLPYSQVALTGLPAHSADQSDPSWRVSGTSFAVNRDGTNLQPLVVNGGSLQGGGTVTGGTIAPTPTSFQSGDVSGKVYRYVVWENDATCSESSCPGSQDLKRVIVAVKLDFTSSGGTRAYQELQATIVNPDVKAPGSPPPGGTNQTPWTFWLTDTPCNFNARQPITADHLTHNTLGVCSDGLKTGPPGVLGTNRGAPDLMYTQAPPLDNSYPDNQQPQYDYATDVEPSQSPSQDKGLQEARPTNILNGGACLTNLNGISSLLSLGSNSQLYLHKWVSRTTTSNSILLTGTGTLNLWTRKLNSGDPAAGKICVWLFTRHLDALGATVDTFTLPTYFTYSQASWQSGGWAEIHVPLSFTALTLPAGDRLGLAVGVEGQGTPGAGLQFFYDQPSFDSRLEVQTTGVLPF